MILDFHLHIHKTGIKILSASQGWCARKRRLLISSQYDVKDYFVQDGLQSRERSERYFWTPETQEGLQFLSYLAQVPLWYGTCLLPGVQSKLGLSAVQR